MHASPSSALLLISILVGACGGDDATPGIDAASTIDAAEAIDAASTIDAAEAIDAPPLSGTDPTFATVPCPAGATIDVEYYSCAFIIGGGAGPVGSIVRFIGCDGHTVRSAGGAVLSTTFAPTCVQITSPGTLAFECEQHPGHTGSVEITP